MKKKIVKIAHLYYDLLNLYGESGNVRAFKKFLERQNIDAEVHFLTIGDKIDFKKYDFYYMGAGSEESQRMVLEDLFPHREEIKEAVDAGKMFLVTGNSMELFGKKIRMQNGKVLRCLGVFEYHACQSTGRIVTEIHYNYDKLPLDKGGYIVGFQNCNCGIVKNNERMFELPNNMNHNNFFATEILGPILIRNPYFTNMLVEKLLAQKGLPYTPIEDTIEFKAYHEYVYNFIINSKLD